jgi:4-alpha-glucanotransferase
MNQELCRAIYHYLAHTPCKLLLVSIDDIIGTLEQQNMPGTVDTYPNWIQKMPFPLEKIKSDKRFIALSKMFSQNMR